MTSYDEAVVLARLGGAVLFANTGGWKRWLHFTEDDGVVRVTLMGSEIAQISPAGMILHDHGYIQRQTTRDAFNWLLPEPWRMWRQDWHVYVDWGWHVFTADRSTEYYDGMFIAFDHEVVST